MHPLILGQTAQLKPLRGFDRLAAAGFSEQDIANIRLQFHAHSAGDYLDQDFESDEECERSPRCLHRLLPLMLMIAWSRGARARS